MRCFGFHDWETAETRYPSRDGNNDSYQQDVCLRCGQIRVHFRRIHWLSPDQIDKWIICELRRKALAEKLIKGQWRNKL